MTIKGRWNERSVENWMRNHVEDYLDDCYAVSMTELAEAACQEFGLYGPAPRFDIPDELFDLAYQTAEWHEK